MRSTVILAALLGSILIPFILAALSPLLAYRQPIYIAAGLAGVLAMGLLLIQPALARGMLPLTAPSARKLHRFTGGAILLLIIVHVGALWATSPPDVIDALLMRSPTPFSIWGVLALVAVCATACLAAMRRALPRKVWRLGHKGLALVIAGGTIAHALLIEGTMEPLSKVVLCILIAGATLLGVITRHHWR